MTVEEFALTATNSGTFTVLVSDSQNFFYGGTGAYRLYFAQFPGAFVVPSGDEGGALTNGGNYDGTIQLGDLDLWSFKIGRASCRERVEVSVISTNKYKKWLSNTGPNA